MAHSLRIAGLLLATTLCVPGVAAAGDRAGNNRTVSSAHQPIVSRTDYSFDVVARGSGLAPGEARRLTGWFDQLGLGYGDTVTIAAPAMAPSRVGDGVGEVLARYGMLVSADPAPVSAGQPAPGTVRVVVSRASARVEGCPDWSRGNNAEYGGASQSNFGCSTAQNLAAAIADPQDLVEGASAHEPADARVSVKAIASYRDAVNTGKAGLAGVSTKGN